MKEQSKKGFDPEGNSKHGGAESYMLSRYRTHLTEEYSLIKASEGSTKDYADKLSAEIDKVSVTLAENYNLYRGQKIPSVDHGIQRLVLAKKKKTFRQQQQINRVRSRHNV